MGLKERRLQRIKDAILKRPYIFSFIFIFLLYLAINLFINKSYTTIPILTSYATWFVLPYSFFTFLLIPFLVALTINLSIMKFKEAKSLLNTKGRSGLTFLGVFGGILGGACPGCFVGLFPALLGLFGVTASLSILPLYGLEIQMISIVFLIVAITFLTRDLVCEVPIKKRNKGKLSVKKP